jgi:hypothetical protein
MRKLLLFVFLLCLGSAAQGQTLLNDLMDTTSAQGKGLMSIYQKYNWLRISTYMQPQWQWAEDKGIRTFAGPDFLSGVNNRFILRRARMKADYLRLNDAGDPVTQVVFQFDVNERGFSIRDVWGRVFENRWNVFSVTGGMFSRPFGYEVNLSSSDRESPERGRASQTLMKSERDLGAMLSIEPRHSKNFRWLRADIALVNGQGIAGNGDYDNHKDLIGRIYSKPQHIGRSKWLLSGGASVFNGGIVSQSAIHYHADGTAILRDSSADNIGLVAPRRYYGCDAQLKIPNRKGYTELRGEYLRGKQTGTLASSESPATYPQLSGAPGPLTTRPFDAAYFYLLQHLGSTHHQAILKLDWYDPNNTVSGAEVSGAKGHTAADVKYTTFGAGYVWYINSNVKLVLYYDHVVNESTSLAAFAEDVKDDVFTSRLQFRF